MAAKPVKTINIAITVLIATAVFIVYYFFAPANFVLFPKCPFHVITGLDCPGCGSQRAFHALLHGNLATAADHNILFICSIPLLMVHFGYKIASFTQNRVIQFKLLYHPLTPKIMAAVVVLFWIVRNIPVYPFSYLSAGL
ncbi:MAG: DUF2752 domain-containing protein [Sphingobacteriaceae bacterium]|nr:MAG: DUF2752 domain-containing protein [Sphingobacteriaceae bacterium]